MEDFNDTSVIFLEATDFNGKKLIGQTGKWFIMVQGSFCGHCTHAKPEFVKAKGLCKKPIQFATIHVDSDDPNTAKLGGMTEQIFGKKVTGIPAFFLYDADTTQSIKYDGRSSADGLLKFIEG